MKMLMWLNVIKSILFSIQLSVSMRHEQAGKSLAKGSLPGIRSHLNMESLPDPQPIAAKIRHQLTTYTNRLTVVLFRMNGSTHAALRASRAAAE